MTPEQKPGNISLSDGTSAVYSDKTKPPKKKLNWSIWHDGQKPTDDDAAFEDCKTFFAPLWNAVTGGKLTDHDETHKQTGTLSVQNPPEDPTGNG